MTCHAILIEKDAANTRARVANTADDALPEGDVTVQVSEAIPAARALIDGKIRGRLIVAMGVGGRETSL
jgi:hypothetical protein